jgi:hypothetical protein
MIDSGWRLEEREKVEDKHGVLIECYGHSNSLGLGINSQHLDIRIGSMANRTASMLHMATTFMTCPIRYIVQNTTLKKKLLQNLNTVSFL